MAETEAVTPESRVAEAKARTAEANATTAENRAAASGESASQRASSFHVPNPGTSTIIAGIGVAIIAVDDVKKHSDPFFNVLYGGILIVILAFVAQFSPALANAIAFLFLLTAVYSLFNKKGK